LAIKVNDVKLSSHMLVLWLPEIVNRFSSRLFYQLCFTGLWRRYFIYWFFPIS